MRWGVRHRALRIRPSDARAWPDSDLSNLLTGGVGNQCVSMAVAGLNRVTEGRWVLIHGAGWTDL
jgi:hypothetical protein